MPDSVMHPFRPIWNENCQVLILGSMPSVQSRSRGFYYANPQNRFWLVIAALFHSEVPTDDQSRRRLLLDHHIAIWDVLENCDIEGSADSSIRNPKVHDLSPMLTGSPIRQIYANGQTAARIYARYLEPITGRLCITLPSTSPANGRFNLAGLVDAWQIILHDLELQGFL